MINTISINRDSIPSNSYEKNINKVKEIKTNQDFKRTRAIQELIQTQIIYSKDLSVINDIYLYKATGPPPSPPPISPPDRQIIFSNISQISHLAKSLSDELIIANELDSIGKCFIQFLPKIEKFYTIYCSKYESANKKLQQFNRKIQSKQKRIPFTSPTSHSSNRTYRQNVNKNHNNEPNHEHSGLKYLRECKYESQGQTTAWDLGSLLIKPVQRCLKYSLLIDQILKFTSLDHPDYQNLILARDGMVDVADKINEATRRNELVGEMISRTGPIAVMYPTVFLVGQQSSTNNNKLNPPVELINFINQVKRSKKSLNRLPGDIRNFEYSVKNWILSADRLTDAFKSTFLLKNNTAHDSISLPRIPHIDVSDLHRYQHLVLLGALNGPLNYLHDEIELQIIPKINELKELYLKPMILIGKYEKRRHLMMSSSSSSNSNSNNRTSGEASSSRSSQSSSIQSTESNSNRALSFNSSENNSTSKVSELEQVENFLLEQLPQLIKSSTICLNLILGNLANSFKLFHSDLIILIKKVVFKT